MHHKQDEGDGKGRSPKTFDDGEDNRADERRWVELKKIGQNPCMDQVVGGADNSSRNQQAQCKEFEALSLPNYFLLPQLNYS
jgi:hypothetical protein